MPGTRNSATYKRARRARLETARAMNEPCVRCGRPINWELNGNHPYGATLDHLDPVMYTGTEDFQPERAGVSHRVCNSRHGARIGNWARTARHPPPPVSPIGEPAVVYTPPQLVPEPSRIF